LTTGFVSPCREIVIRTSAALFRHITFCEGQDDAMAENNNLKSSLRANSSAGQAWLHRRTSIYNKELLKTKINQCSK